jgi:hypothetical protein
MTHHIQVGLHRIVFMPVLYNVLLPRFWVHQQYRPVHRPISSIDIRLPSTQFDFRECHFVAP